MSEEKPTQTDKDYTVGAAEIGGLVGIIGGLVYGATQEPVINYAQTPEQVAIDQVYAEKGSENFSPVEVEKRQIDAKVREEIKRREEIRKKTGEWQEKSFANSAKAGAVGAAVSGLTVAMLRRREKGRAENNERS